MLTFVGFTVGLLVLSLVVVHFLSNISDDMSDLTVAVSGLVGDVAAFRQSMAVLGSDNTELVGIQEINLQIGYIAGALDDLATRIENTEFLVSDIYNTTLTSSETSND